MKTLNLTLRTILLTFTIISTTSFISAYSFKVDGIYYDINGDEVSVTFQRSYQEYAGNYIYHTYYDNDYVGRIIIPEFVSFNGKTYAVTSIGDHAFYKRYKNESQITSVIIPSTVASIGEEAFYNCSSLRGITCQSTMPPIVTGNNSFFGISFNNTTLYVPLALLDEYQTSSIWRSFSNIIGFGQNTFSIADHTTLYGDTIVIPVTMENVDDITAFQTDIYLPAGFELLKEENDYKVSLSSRKGRDHVIMTSDAPDGAVRILSYSPTLKKFSGNEGELFYLTIKVPNDGDSIVTYPIWLRKTLLTTTDEEEIGALETLGDVNVYFYILGDVDHSGTITVTDVVFTAKYILYQNPEPFVFEAADMNGDGKITITDVVKIANLVLDQDYPEPETLRKMAPNNAGDSMSGEFFNNTVSINLDNEMDYTALQLNLTLPEGMTASEFALSERASDLGLIVKDRGNGKVRLLAYSPNLKTIMGNEGSVLTFNVDGMKGDIVVDRIELVTPNGESVHLNGFNVAADHLTALNEMAAGKTIASVNYFNLAGQSVAEPAAGVTLVVTTYTDGSRTTNKVIR